MNCAVEEHISKMECENALVREIKNDMVKHGGGPRLNNSETKSSVVELFPWVLEFKNMCKFIHMDRSMASLTELMQFYLRNVSVSVIECYTRPLRAAKLKDCISESLLLFLYIYRDLSEDRDRALYLNNMSDLVALYIDMELKTSRKSKEDQDKICARVTSCLYVYLEHSTEHLLDTLVKIQFMCRSYHHILDPIVKKIIKNIPAHPESNIMYTRYLLIYRLWRKINGDLTVKNQITTTAIASLGPPPSAFPLCILENLLPKVPKCQPNSTKALLQHKFDIKKCCELFIQYCREKSASVSEEQNGGASSINTSNRINTQTPEDIACNNIKCVDNNVNSVTPDKKSENESMPSENTFKSLKLKEDNSFKLLGTFENNISVNHTSPKSVKLDKSPLRRKSKKSNEIVIIDLTSDVAFEKCIKKRTPRKVPWLEEAMKRIDSKITKSSQKIKKKKQEKIGRAYLFNTSKTANHQQEEISGHPQVTENASSKSAPYTCKTVDVADGEVKMNGTSSNCSITLRKMTELEINSMDTNIKVSCTRPSMPSVKHQLPDSFEKPRSVGSNVLRSGNKCDRTSDARSDEQKNDRLNKQAVIQRLIERDTFSETEKCGEAESFKKICDLKTEPPNTVDSVSLCTENNSKDDNFNRSSKYVNVTKDKLTQDVTSSMALVEYEQNDQSASSNGTLDYINTSKDFYTSHRVHNVADHKTKCAVLIVAENDMRNNETAVSTEALEVTESSTNVEQKKLSGKPFLNSAERSVCAMEEDGRSTKENLTNGILNYGVSGIASDTQVELKVDKSVDMNEDVKEDKSSNDDIRESIFGPYSTSRRDISSAFKVTMCPIKSGKGDEETSCINISSETVEKVIHDNRKKNFNEDASKFFDERDPKGINLTIRRKGVRKDSCDDSNEAFDLSVARGAKKTELDKSLENNRAGHVAKSNCIMQDSDLQDNIDGLSLLASVSQHVPHLKAEFDIPLDQIKVKDYASLSKTPYNQSTDDETDTSDSSNTVSQLLENPSTEVINRIVGIYPEDALEKVALHVEVTSTTDTETSSTENGTYNIGSHVNETNCDTDTLSHVSSMETNVQPVKENTNVILNGETVVLLQKSPNSNLYIINKAVENSKDHANDDEICRVKDKSWLSPPEEYGQFEVITSSDHAAFNLEILAYNKELSYQENKFNVGRNKGIKVEPEENDLANLAEAKSYSKKVSLPNDILSVTPQMYQDVGVLSKSAEKRMSSKASVSYRQNIKQEFNSIPNHIASNCAIQGCSGIHAHPHEVDAQHSLHIPVTHPTTLTPIYGNCAASTELCVPCHKHCTSVSCSLQINTTASLHSHSKSSNPCGRSHCSCLNCTYDIVTHCRQCIHPTTDSHISRLESTPYFLPTHSSVQTPAVQEHERTKSEAVIGKLYDDQLLCKLENTLMQSNPLEKLDAQCDSEKLYRKEMNNKLPLKKRLKAHAVMSMAYEEKLPIKSEKLDNYPGIPMMSIAALEALESTQKKSSQIMKSEYELSPTKKEDPRTSCHFNSNLVRRDYYKDVHMSNLHHNHSKESTRKHERQFRSANDQSSNTVCQESCHQRTFKTSGQRKEVGVPSSTSLKRFGAGSIEQEDPYKKAKKAQSPIRQTRSSKRNVPKVNYCYTDVDPEWNPSGESKRKRKKTSR